jgi:hypothetical protein
MLPASAIPASRGADESTAPLSATPLSVIPPLSVPLPASPASAGVAPESPGALPESPGAPPSPASSGLEPSDTPLGASSPVVASSPTVASPPLASFDGSCAAESCPRMLPSTIGFATEELSLPHPTMHPARAVKPAVPSAHRDRLANIETSWWLPRARRANPAAGSVGCRSPNGSVGSQSFCGAGGSTGSPYSALAIERFSSSLTSAGAFRLARPLAGARNSPLRGPPRTWRVQSTPAQASMTMFSVAMSACKKPLPGRSFTSVSRTTLFAIFLYGSLRGSSLPGGSEGMRVPRRPVSPFPPASGSVARHLKCEATNSRRSNGVVR